MVKKGKSDMWFNTVIIYKDDKHKLVKIKFSLKKYPVCLQKKSCFLIL